MISASKAPRTTHSTMTNTISKYFLSTSDVKSKTLNDPMPPKPPEPMNTVLQSFQLEWKTLYATTLPAAAKLPSNHWPVSLDHCFARIILDNAIGIDRPWTEKIMSPAYKNMTTVQLQKAIKMGQGILNGEVDIWEMDERSLQMRGKKSKKRTKTIEDENNGGREKKKHKVNTMTDEDKALHDDLHRLIASSSKTLFQKSVLRAILQVPAGKFTTYKALSTYLHSSPRAVGNALRNNPFAPMVPCHRVLAADKSIGGFGGDWGSEGKHVTEKIGLLRAEKVKFDGKGRVIGVVWDEFV